MREPRAYAAAALFRLTGEKSYERQFASDTASIGATSALWDDAEYGPLVYALASDTNKADTGLHERIRSAVLATADELVSVSSKRALRWGGKWYMPRWADIRQRPGCCRPLLVTPHSHEDPAVPAIPGCALHTGTTS